MSTAIDRASRNDQSLLHVNYDDNSGDARLGEGGGSVSPWYAEALTVAGASHAIDDTVLNEYHAVMPCSSGVKAGMVRV